MGGGGGVGEELVCDIQTQGLQTLGCKGMFAFCKAWNYRIYCQCHMLNVFYTYLRGKVTE